MFKMFLDHGGCVSVFAADVDKGDCGVGAFVWSTALAYNADKLKVAPTGWADFWNVKDFPGKRALPDYACSVGPPGAVSPYGQAATCADPN